MAQQKVIEITNLIYAMPKIRRKDEVQAVASILVNSEEAYRLNMIEERVDTSKLKELAKGGFDTDLNENEYKKILANVSSIINGYNDLRDAIIFDDGEIPINTEDLKRVGKAGKLKLYTIK